MNVEQLAKAVCPIGKVEARVRGTRCFLIRLRPGTDPERAKQRLERVAGVKALEAAEEPVDFRSVRSIGRKIEHMREETEKEQSASHDTKDNDGGLDYLEAYRFFIAQRAYPKDEFDWESWTRARNHAKLMPLAQRADPGMASQFWQFAGPTSLQIPDDALGGGPSPVSGRINAVAFDPTNSNTIYVGAANGGLWRSTDGGAYWTWLSKDWSELAVNCIAVDPTDPLTIYVGRGDYHGGIWGSHGIMKTTDGGATWKEIATSLMGPVSVASLLIDPTNHKNIIAGTSSQNGLGTIYVSSDGGGYWMMASSGAGGKCQFPTLAASLPSQGTVRFYAVAAGSANVDATLSRILYSDNHGSSWKTLASPVADFPTDHKAFVIASSPINSKNVYVLDSQNKKLYYSLNQGSTWTDMSKYLPSSAGDIANFTQSYYNYHLECGSRGSGASAKDILYLGEIDIMASSDQGRTWTSIGGPSGQTRLAGARTHCDQQCLAVSPSDPNTGVFGNDGGIYRYTYDAGSGHFTVLSLNRRLGITMFYKIACHPTQMDWLMGGTQDNCTPFTNGDVSNWSNCAYGDGGGVVIDQDNPLVSFATSEYLHIYTTNDGWKSKSDITPKRTQPENLPFVTPLVFSHTAQRLYSATNQIWMWDAKTSTWSQSGDLLNMAGNILAIALAPSDNSQIYAGSINGLLLKSTTSWDQYTPLATPVDGWFTTINVNPTNPNDIIIGYSGTGISHLWRCKNTNSIAAFWENVSGNGSNALPDAPLNTFARDIDDPQNTWYVGTDVGVFLTSNAGKTWANAGSPYGLPSVIVNDLVAVSGTRYLNAGTYGRGWWRLYLPVGGGNLTDLTVSPNPVVGGNNVLGTVTISKPAPTQGTTIQVKCSSNISGPSSVIIPAGKVSADFVISTAGVSVTGTATVSATQATLTKVATFSIQPAKLISVDANPNPVVGGLSATVKVSLDGAAASPGVTINLACTNPSVKIPTSVIVATGATFATFTVGTAAVSASTSATITASTGVVSVNASLSILPATIQTLTASDSIVVGGSSTVVKCRLTFNGPTSAEGVTVKLASSKPLLASVPASITAKMTGSDFFVTFVVTHMLVKSSETLAITASLGSKSISTNLQLSPFAPIDLSFVPFNVIGATKSTGTVTLNATPGSKSGAISVRLSTYAAGVSVPISVSVPVNKATGTFSVTTSPVTSTTQAVINATVGTNLKQGTLTVLAPSLTSISVSPASLRTSVTKSAIGTVTISGPAPKGGIGIQLVSSDTKSALVPVSVSIPAGQTKATFRVTVAKVTATVRVTLGAGLKNDSKSVQLTLSP